MPFGFTATTATQATRASPRFRRPAARLAQLSTPKAMSRTVPTKDNANSAMPRAYPACRFAHSKVKGTVHHRSWGSVRRIVCERTINSPLRRCHQKSGSATPRALIVNSPREKTIVNTREVSKSRFTVATDDIVAPNARDVMTKPKLKKALLLFLTGMLSMHLVIAWNARRLVYLGYPDFT